MTSSDRHPAGRQEKALPAGLAADLLARLADRHGTPLFVTSAATIRSRFGRLRSAFPDARILYAAKANTNLRILELLRRCGTGLDAVSLGEVEAGLRAGFEPAEIVYTGTFPSDGELREVLERGVRVNVDAASDFERVAAFVTGARVGLRVNPDTGAGHHEHVVTGGPRSKFGVPLGRACDAFRLAERLGLVPDGLQMHIGSGILDPGPHQEAARRLGLLAGRLREDGFELTYLDVGGGFGVPYRPDERPLDVDGLAEGVREALPEGPRLVIEPGRYLVAESTVLLTRVTSRKDDFVGVDAGLHTLLRPALYGAYHHLSNLSRPGAERRAVTVVGPICETGDVLARERELADPRAGDLLAVHDTGAYGYAMASRYNSRPLPAEVLVDGTAELIREREGRDDLFSRVRWGC